MTDEPSAGPTVAAILAGGVGTRLYPAARSDRPKQFLSVTDDGPSLLARTARRCSFADRQLVVTREAFAERAADHAPQATIETEPAPLDTGPAALYAAHRVRQLHAAGEGADHEEPVIVTTPADHYVPDGDAFRRTIRRGVRVARETESLVVFGVEPTRTETGYGYIEPGADRDGAAEVAAFHEKPDAETAAEYVERGLLWNAGIFVWTPSALFDACRGTPLARTAALLADDQPAAAYEAAPAVSIDTGLMEHAENAIVVPATFEWDDLGSWDALQRVIEPDGAGNTVAADSITIDAADNVIAGDHHVSVVGVEELCVVAVDDRVVVLPVEAAQRVREVVARLGDEF